MLNAYINFWLCFSNHQTLRAASFSSTLWGRETRCFSPRKTSKTLITGSWHSTGSFSNSRTLFLASNKGQNRLKPHWFAWRPINHPSPGKRYSLLLRPSTPSSVLCPWRACWGNMVLLKVHQSHLVCCLGSYLRYKDTVRCTVQGAKVSGLSQRQLTDLDCVFVKNTHFFIQLKTWLQYWGYLVFHRATGQAHKPAPPVNTGKNSSSAKNGAGNWISRLVWILLKDI